MSVDDGIAGISAAVSELGLENSTYFFVTSDHGWNLGQHRLPGGKHNVYDHSTRIPMVRAPSVCRLPPASTCCVIVRPCASNAPQASLAATACVYLQVGHAA